MIITHAPVRISIGGGGTDLPFYYTKHKASLVTAAIDKYIYTTVKPCAWRKSLIKYSKTEEVDDNFAIEHPLIRESMRLLNVRAPVELTTLSDVPPQSGLGSSSTCCVSMLNAFHTLKDEYVSKRVLAEEACTIEMDILKDPVGKQDQYAAAYGGIIHLAINKKGTVTVTHINISHETVKDLEKNLLLFYTGIQRSASQVLAKQKKAAEDDPEKLQYLSEIKAMGESIKRTLERGNTRRFGEWLNVHWEMKRKMSKAMTNPDIDRWYEIALRNGAIGGKIMGAGGGGFFMFYCDSNHDTLRKAMADAGLVEMPFTFDFDGAKIVFNSR